MSIRIDMTPEEVAALKEITNVDDDAEAIAKAAREYLRLRRLRELKDVSGKFEYDTNWLESQRPECHARDGDNSNRE